MYLSGHKAQEGKTPTHNEFPDMTLNNLMLRIL